MLRQYRDVQNVQRVLALVQKDPAHRSCVYINNVVAGLRRFRRIVLFLRRVLHPYKGVFLLRAPRHLRQLLRARAGITVENEIVIGRCDRAQRELLIAGHGTLFRKRWKTDSYVIPSASPAMAVRKISNRPSLSCSSVWISWAMRGAAGPRK